MQLYTQDESTAMKAHLVSTLSFDIVDWKRNLSQTNIVSTFSFFLCAYESVTGSVDVYFISFHQTLRESGLVTCSLVVS